MSVRNPPAKQLAYNLPSGNSFVICNATVPLALIHGVSGTIPKPDRDGLVQLDIHVESGRIARLEASSRAVREHLCLEECADVGRGMVFPTFVDLHTHIDKGHTCDRSRNPTGTLSGADKSTAGDLSYWDHEDLERRMEFSLRVAFSHGTSALRTHLINLVPKQVELTWAVFNKMKERWAGRIDLQGVSLVVLSYFRDEKAAAHLADTIKAAGGVMGCAVCCSEFGGKHDDEWTTCNRDRAELLDRIFVLAAERGLGLDFHVDENGNEEAHGLRCIAEATLRHGYQGRVVCGHCCSLAQQSPLELEATLELAKQAGITVVSLPLVNEWTQDRDTAGGRTPRWRGITCLKELKVAGVPVAVASDNTRDQFYAYGDLDMLEVFTQSVRMGHLDRPTMGSWPKIVTSAPAAAMGLKGKHGTLRVGGRANLILFRARNYGELLSRSQHDRVVVRDGRVLTATCPDYSELDQGSSLAPQAFAATSLVADTEAATSHVHQVEPSNIGKGTSATVTVRASVPSFAAAFGGAAAGVAAPGKVWRRHSIDMPIA